MHQDFTKGRANCIRILWRSETGASGFYEGQKNCIMILCRSENTQHACVKVWKKCIRILWRSDKCIWIVWRSHKCILSFESRKMLLHDFMKVWKNAPWRHEGLERAHQDFTKARKLASWLHEGLEKAHPDFMKVKKCIRIVGRPERAHPGARRHMIHFTPDPKSNSDPPPDRMRFGITFS